MDPIRIEEYNKKSLEHNCAEISEDSTVIHAQYYDEPEVIEVLDKKRWSVKDILDDNTTYRTLNHWQEKGLIGSPSKKEASWKWKKFDYDERIWIELLKELRNFGVPINTILKLKQYLFIDLYRPLLVSMLYSLGCVPCYLVLFEDGFGGIYTNSEYSTFQHKIASHIIVNMNKLMMRIFVTDELKPIPSFNVEISDKTPLGKIVNLLSQGKNISIKQPQGENIYIEYDEEKPVNKSLKEILEENSFQDISIKVENGKVTRIKAVKKTKMKK